MEWKWRLRFWNPWFIGLLRNFLVGLYALQLRSNQPRSFVKNHVWGDAYNKFVNVNMMTNNASKIESDGSSLGSHALNHIGLSKSLNGCQRRLTCKWAKTRWTAHCDRMLAKLMRQMARLHSKINLFCTIRASVWPGHFNWTCQAPLVRFVRK